MSVQATYDDTLATADLVTEEHVEIHITLWRGTKSGAEGTDASTTATAAATTTATATQLLHSTTNYYD